MKVELANLLARRGAFVVATELPAELPEGRVWIQLFPAGKFTLVDGRPGNADGAPYFLMDDDAAATLLAFLKAHKNPRVIDYDHQTEYREENGQPAIAAGWMHDYEWRPGDGFYAQVEWTAKAREHILATEYRFISPVFNRDKKTGRIIRLKRAGLLNTPAIDGMEPVTASEADTKGEDPVKEKLVALLGLAAEASDEDVIAGVTKLRAPDPTKFVPMDEHKKLQDELVKLRTESRKGEVENIIAKALDEGRLTKKQEDWARKVGLENPAFLRDFVASAEPVVKAGSQTGGKEPEGGEAGKLTEAELYVCKQFGTSEEEFLKLKEKK